MKRDLTGSDANEGDDFDADGTLLDSMGLWRRIDREFLEAHHYPYSTEISEQVETMSLQQSAVYFQQLLADREAISVRQITQELDALCAEPMKPKFRRCLLFQTF